MISGRGDMSNFMGVGIFWIGLNRADLGCWRLTSSFQAKHIYTPLTKIWKAFEKLHIL